MSQEEFDQMCQGYDVKTGAPQITAEECIKLHQTGKLFVIDTREDYEHNFACIPQAHLLTPSTIGMTLCMTTGSGMRYADSKQLPDSAAIPEDVSIVTACTAGLRSGFCAVDLSQKLNRPVKNLHGGIIAWYIN